MKATNPTLLLGLLMPLCVIAQTQETSRLPYASVCRVVATDWKSLPGLTNQEIRLTIKSKILEVKPSDVHLYIDSHPHRISIPVKPDGTFSLPISDDLLKENPDIVANQPRGTLELKADITLQGSGPPQIPDVVGNRQRYESLFLLEDVKSQLAKALAGPTTLSVLSRTVVVAYLMPKRDRGAAQVVIEAAKGAIRVPRDTNGTFRLARDPLLASENPWVLMPTNHEWRIETRLEEEAEHGGGTLRR